MKIGFINRGHITWTAGSSYTRSMGEALASACPADVELCVLGGSDATFPELPGVGVVRGTAPHLTAEEIARLVDAHGIDVLLPLTEVVPPDIACALVGWIPDFQHRRLPRYFSESQRAERDVQFDYLVANCDVMMFSSESALADYREFYPAAATPGEVVPFPSSFAYDAAERRPDPRPVLEGYGLPPAYAVVINQFWRHKNHRLVVEAVAQARRSNPDVFVVMTGMLSDSRDPTNEHVSAIVQRVFREKLFGHLALLGEVPGDHLLALLRGARLVIQPSEFEGWNTTVEDALAFGKPVACSDISTHREQAPGAFFFAPDDPSALAAHLAGQDWSSPGWRGEESERGPLEDERARGREWGARAIAMCRRVVERRRTEPKLRQEWEPSEEAVRLHPPFRVRQLARRVKQLEGELKSARTASKKEVADLRAELGRIRAKADEFRNKLDAGRRKPLRTRLRDAIFGGRD